MICIVQYLAGQNLAFRGDSTNLYETNNGNFLKLVDKIAKFDPIMMEHLSNIRRSKELCQNMPHYLSNHFQNELIHLLSRNIQKEILSCLRAAKYYSIILDESPDASHVEQLTVIIRFVYCSPYEVEIREHFLGFFKVLNTTGEELFNFLKEEILSKFEIILDDMRGQGYDNGANMSGKYVGLQAQILKINPRAMFLPCSAHTINLSVNDAAKISYETQPTDLLNEYTEEKIQINFIVSTHQKTSILIDDYGLESRCKIKHAMVRLNDEHQTIGTHRFYDSIVRDSSSWRRPNDDQDVGARRS
ncbi:unnamed protein product [Diabrotica balteata]|uniref:DUF4371 domain-containing protein n=1 Tax=Diabrotica balteata TaxID=107213 RepID=A0A9N9SXH2_DIABA|nr:unnamed protein product [Diabrotica balteata]